MPQPVIFVLITVHTHTHTHTQPFYRPFFGTTGVSRRQKKSSSGIYGARENNRGRHTDHPAGRRSIRTNQRPPPSSPIFSRPDAVPACRPTKSQSTEGKELVLITVQNDAETSRRILWALAAHSWSLTAVPRSTQPSVLRIEQ